MTHTVPRNDAPVLSACHPWCDQDIQALIVWALSLRGAVLTEWVEYLIVTVPSVGVKDAPSRVQVTSAPSTSKLEKIEAGLLDSIGTMSSENSSSGNLLRAHGQTEAVSTHNKQQRSSKHTAWVPGVLVHPSCRGSATAQANSARVITGTCGEGYHSKRG